MKTSHEKDRVTPIEWHRTRLVPAAVFAAALVSLACLLAQGSIYQSPNLYGHLIAAEGLAGFTPQPGDVQLIIHPTFAEVISNANRRHTYVNAIGFKPFLETFPDGSTITLGRYEYVVEMRLPMLPAPNPAQSQNSQAVHAMVQLWDGRNALWPANKRTIEATLYWELNSWTADYGKLKIYSGTSTTPTDIGLSLPPDTAWHTVRIVADLETGRYVSLQVDTMTKDLSGVALAQRDHSSDWGADTTVKLSITTESLAAYPSNPADRFFWTTEFRNVSFSAVPPGDLNYDGCVNHADLSILMAKIRARSTDLTYDLNGDGKVNIADARFLVLHFTNQGGAPCDTPQ